MRLSQTQQRGGALQVLKHVTASLLPDVLVRHLRPAYYSRLVRSARERSNPGTAHLRYLLRPGDTVIDVGANFGIYTKFLSRCVGPHGCVLSVEPVPDTFAVLSAVVRDLRLENVRLLDCAASERDGLVTMEIPAWDTGADNLWEAHVTDARSNPAGRRLSVFARSIDSLVMDLPAPPVFIKLDVEGHESQCLNGAGRTLERHHPSWLIEVADPDDPASAGFSLFACLREHGYGVWRAAGATLVPRESGEQSLNYWFLQPEHLARMREGGLNIANPVDR